MLREHPAWSTAAASPGIRPRAGTSWTWPCGAQVGGTGSWVILRVVMLLDGNRVTLVVHPAGLGQCALHRWAVWIGETDL